MKQNYMPFALLGAALLFLGSFLPILRVPIVGDLNYFANGKGDGVLMIGLALLSLSFAGRKRFDLLLCTGLAAGALLGYTLVLLNNRISEMKASLSANSGDLFSGLSQALASSVQIQWGWAVLALGAFILVGVGYVALRDASGAMQGSTSRVAVTALASVVGVVGVAIVGGAGMSQSDASSMRVRTSSSDVDTSLVFLPSSGARYTSRPAWNMSRDTSVMDRTVRTVLSLDADSAVYVSYGKKTPTLYIRCRDHKTDLFINVETTVESPYGEYDVSDVRIRLDDGRPERQRWSESTDHEALFAPSPIGFARRLAVAKQLFFEFKPFQRGPVVATFTLSGLSDKLPMLAQECGWKVAGAPTRGAAK